MLRIAICDDDGSSINYLSEIIIQYSQEKDLQFEIVTFLSGIDLLKNFKGYDLIFLDIDMPEMDGIEVGLKIKGENSRCEIIYVTNYSDYAYRSFSIRPFGYVVKPFSRENIFKELNDFINKRNEKNEIHQIYLSEGKEILKLNAVDILYFEYSVDKHVKIVTGHKTYDMHGPLRYFYEKAKTYGFTYPHKSFVVNMLHIAKISHFDVVMKNNSIIPIAQKKKVQFMEEYNLFIQKQFGKEI